VVAVALVGGGLRADDVKKDEKKDELKLAGVWVKEVDSLPLQFDFSKKDVLVVTVGTNENGLVINSKLTVDKDNKVTAKATKIETKGDFPIKLRDDYEFSFKIKIDGKTAKISDFTANEHEEQGKGAVEGEYTKKEDK
jgi:hypothetical protein